MGKNLEKENLFSSLGFATLDLTCQIVKSSHLTIWSLENGTF